MERIDLSSRLRLVVFVVLTLPGIGFSAHAQQPRLASSRSAAVVALRNAARADSLVARAERLHGTPRQWVAAADLYVRAATLRGDAPESIRDLRLAAFAQVAAGNHRMGQHLMEQAAEQALMIGDVERGILGYVDAAEIALERKRPHDTRRLVERARRLLAAPQLAEARKLEIARRISTAPSLAGVAVSP